LLVGHREQCHGARSPHVSAKKSRAVRILRVWALAWAGLGRIQAVLPGLFSTVARPRQADHALCALAELCFDPGAVLKLKIPFLFFIRFQTEFKLQKFVSKYPKLQKL
jgi:hypothetical protein